MGYGEVGEQIIGLLRASKPLTVNEIAAALHAERKRIAPVISKLYVNECVERHQDDYGAWRYRLKRANTMPDNAAVAKTALS
jgi:predicted transcriptional regulator